MKVLVVKFNALDTKMNLNVYCERKLSYWTSVMLEGGVYFIGE
jgi:hypothetical protein